MSNRLKDWFNEPIGLHQSVGRTLPVMALTTVSPTHKDAYLGNSCYGQCALEIRRLKEAGALSDDYSIVILGLDSGRVFHTVLAKGGVIILDTEYKQNENHLKTTDPYLHKNVVLTVLKDTSIRDFERDYVAKVILPLNPSGPKPSAD